ncbi:hypothetical protein AB0C84_14840 [Actinomadura sp. NPDC048955]|uniref:hypothetical protein n=1 Tax=Actinomadura sp. NPDC048955 TaxID=3158228 RepID=UPI0033E6727E
MALPSWRETKVGTMKRVALWLVSEVGVGEVFTKEELRGSFPGVSQVDRRMRDLRDHGWRIDTNREDASLGAHEQRFVEMGEPVWEPGKATRAQTSITAVQRRELMRKDGNLCRFCGIGPGERYAGTYETAQLDIARRQVRQADGISVVRYVVECKRCRLGGRDLAVDTGQFAARINALSGIEREIFATWLKNDQREHSKLERLWAEYRTLPADSREEIRKSIEPLL